MKSHGPRFAATIIVGALSWLVYAEFAAASLIGDEIGVRVDVQPVGFANNIFQNPDVLVSDPMPELMWAFSLAVIPDGPRMAVDGMVNVSSESFTVIFAGREEVGAVFDSTITLTGLDWRDDTGALISGVIVGVTQVSGPDIISSIVFDDDSIIITPATITYAAGESVMFEFAIETVHAIPLIPEPATLFLFGLGLAGVVVRHRRLRP